MPGRLAARRVVLCAAAILPVTRLAAQIEVDLAQVGTVHSGLSISGPVWGSLMGASVAGAGDFNGDGLDDVICGAPFAPGGPGLSGEAWVITGSREPNAPLGILRLMGIRSEDRWGDHVSGGCDLNSDGFSDVMVGSTNADGPSDDRFAAGAVCAIFGRAGEIGGSLSISQLDGSDGFLVHGPSTQGYMAVPSAGDIDGDGTAELIAGAKGIDGGGNPPPLDIGKVFVIAAPDAVSGHELDLQSLPAPEAWSLIGAERRDGLGTDVAAVGDMNGDGICDFVAGSLQEDSPWDLRGECYVVFGHDTGWTESASVSDLNGDNGFEILGAELGGVRTDDAGEVVAPAGDVNGDGCSDLLISAGGARRPDTNSTAGACYVVFGKPEGFGRSLELASLDGSNGFVIRGVHPVSMIEPAVASAGDINGDGLADIILGASLAPLATISDRQRSGEAYVILGSPPTVGPELDLASPWNGIRIRGAAAGNFAGSSVSTAGDVNGDGVSDIVIGAKGFVTPEQPGAVYILHSPYAPPDTATCRAFARSGNAPRLAVGTCGDGSDNDSPWSRCWIDFDGGQGPGNKNSSLQTVTLTRNDAGIRILKPERLANVQWRVQTDRTGWRKTRITLKYTDAEIAGLREETLRVWRATTPRGPWALYSSGMVREAQRNRISVNVPALGYFVIEGDPAPQQSAEPG